MHWGVYIYKCIVIWHVAHIVIVSFYINGQGWHPAPTFFQFIYCHHRLLPYNLHLLRCLHLRYLLLLLMLFLHLLLDLLLLPQNIIFLITGRGGALPLHHFFNTFIYICIFLYTYINVLQGRTQGHAPT